ncbi:MAG: signal peptide peptidase SppA [Acidimicrobiia bacterium]
MSGKRIAALAVLGVVLLSLVALALVPARSGFRVSGDAVALVRLAGPIQEGASPSLLAGGGITPQVLRERLRTAGDDPFIKAVVLRIDSPGGTVAASQEMAGMVRDFPKPVVVSMGDVAASGGYYLASQADRIVAQPGTLTGSVGVIFSTFDVEGLFDKLGIEIEAVTAGEHKDMFLPGRFTPERRRIVQEMVDDLYEQFVGAVARGRGLSEDEVRELATGQPYTGQQALALGLVDRLGGLDEAIAEAEQLAGIEDAQVVELTPSFFEELFFGPGLAGVVRAGIGIDPELVLLRELLTGYLVPRYGT